MLNAAEWPQYRGAAHNAISPDPIETRWSAAHTTPLWKSVTRNGFCSFAVQGDLAVTQVRRTVDNAQKEVCVALSVTNGLELWAATIDEANYDSGSGSDDGPRTTPSLDSDSVYVLSSRLKLYRLRRADGAVVWKTNLLAGFGGAVLPWQHAASPLMEEGRIFVNVNSATRSLIAVSAVDGTLAWRSTVSEASTHATPVLATIGGERQVLFATQRGLVSVTPDSGQLLWSHPYPFEYDTSLAVSPVVESNRVFVSGAYSMGSFAVEVGQNGADWETRQLWYDSRPGSHWMTPVCHGGYIYGHFGSSSYSDFRCVSLATGEEMWSAPGFGRAGAVLAGGCVLALTESGLLVAIQPSPAAYQELGRFQAVTGKCWNSPAVANGRVYVRSSSEAAAYDLSKPALRFEAPQIGQDGRLRMRVRTVNGAVPSPDRLGAVTVVRATDLRLGMGEWEPVTNVEILADGSASVPLGADGSTAYFRLLETSNGP